MKHHNFYVVILVSFTTLLVNPELSASMEFKNIHIDLGTDCICTEGCIYNPDEVFAFITLNDTLTENDFKSYWELGRRDIKKKGCGTKCSLKAQSMSIHNDLSKDEVKKIYKEIFPLTPAYIQYLSIIKFKEDCGVTKASPSYRNPHHYSFYKCDEFKLENVELVASINLHTDDV